MNTGNQQFDGNVAVAGNAAVGGNLNVNGRALFKQDLKVEGYLDAKNVRTPNVGLFIDEETLAANHPRPRNGMYALVGDSLPAKLYVVVKGKWKYSGQEDCGIPEVDGTQVCDALVKEVRDAAGAADHAAEAARNVTTAAEAAKNAANEAAGKAGAEAEKAKEAAGKAGEAAGSVEAVKDKANAAADKANDAARDARNAANAVVASANAANAAVDAANAAANLAKTNANTAANAAISANAAAEAAREAAKEWQVITNEEIDVLLSGFEFLAETVITAKGVSPLKLNAVTSDNRTEITGGVDIGALSDEEIGNAFA